MKTAHLIELIRVMWINIKLQNTVSVPANATRWADEHLNNMRAQTRGAQLSAKPEFANICRTLSWN